MFWGEGLWWEERNGPVVRQHCAGLPHLFGLLGIFPISSRHHPSFSRNAHSRSLLLLFHVLAEKAAPLGDPL